MGLPGEPPAALLFDSELVVGQEGKKKRGTVRAVREWQCPSLALALCCLQFTICLSWCCLSLCVHCSWVHTDGSVTCVLGPVCAMIRAEPHGRPRRAQRQWCHRRRQRTGMRVSPGREVQPGLAPPEPPSTLARWSHHTPTARRRLQLCFQPSVWLFSLT